MLSRKIVTSQWSLVLMKHYSNQHGDISLCLVLLRVRHLWTKVFEWQLNPFLFSQKIGLDLQKSKSTETDLMLYSKTNRRVQTPSAVSHSGQMPTSALLIVEPWIFNEPLSPFRIEEQKRRRSRSSQFQYSWITVFALFSPCFHYLHLLQFIFICE